MNAAGGKVGQKTRILMDMRSYRAVLITVALFLAAACFCLLLRAAYPRPYRDEVAKSGVPTPLAYAVMKAESGFCEDAVSRAGAVGLMQIKPATAEFICARAGMPFDAARLYDGAYNAAVGCMYLNYLLEKFSLETALAAYNAGEGTVRRWLGDPAYSSDGASLTEIPYPETRAYLKKVLHFRKIYQILYG